MTTTTAAQQQRRIAIAVDLSNESAFAVQWAVENYLRPGDSVVLLHVSRTPVLYGADWGSVDILETADEDKNRNNTASTTTTTTSKKRKEEALKKELDASTAAKVQEMGGSLARANIPFRVHIVKDHDMKERLCLEMERLAPSAAIMGSRGIGASSSTSRSPVNNSDSGQVGGGGGLGSVSDYCVRHCVCPVVVVRYPNEKADEEGKAEPVVEMHSGSDLESDNYNFHRDDASENQQQQEVSNKCSSSSSRRGSTLLESNHWSVDQRTDA